MNRLRVCNVVLWVVCLVIVGGAPSAADADQGVDVLIAHPKPYGPLAASIRDLGGTVRHEYKNIDAVAATIPENQVDAVKSLAGVTAVRRDTIVSLPAPPSTTRPGFGEITATFRFPEGAVQAVEAPFAGMEPAGYFPTDALLTRTSEFWTATGHFGEDVIIGIMDTGTAEVDAIAGRLVGGESFLSATPAIDDGLGPNDPLNNPHGTWVATVAGANAIFGFFSTDDPIQSLMAHIPEAVIADYFGPGVDGVPMIGQAPSALFYALKIFNVAGRSSGAVTLAAFDRAVELKELWDAGDPAGVNLQVLNGSWSGGSLYSADDPFFAAMIAVLHEAGIVTCFSASNAGPSALTVGDPGLARNSLTVGATNVAAYEKVLRDIQFGLGTGDLWRANDTHLTADFSSRGPTADGRYDPDITAPGYAIFAQGPEGLALVSGTSFSAPMVAGAVALLLSAEPTATPDGIRGALLQGANPGILEDRSGPNDQGFGFLDVMAAWEQLQLGAENPPDIGLEKQNVDVNARRLGVEIIKSTVFTGSTGWLLPGETVDFAVETIEKPLTGLRVAISVEATLPGEEQNQLFGDDVLLVVHSAKTSSFGDYRVGAFVAGAAQFELGPQDLESGLTRVTVMGDWTNAGEVKAHVTIAKKFGPPGQSLTPFSIGKIGDGELLAFEVDVPADQPELDIFLGWKADWEKWPTNDLDILIFDPDLNLVLVDNDGDGDADGISLDVPERVTIADPQEGTWHLYVDGFTVWQGEDTYYLLTNIK